MLNHSKKSDELPIIQNGEAEIPGYIKDKIHPSLVTLLDPFSPQAEQFRLLKNNILFPETGKPARCIMVTSTSPAEGKSFVAANLAVSIARSIDEYVLLIDCDLRRPVQHQLFNIDLSSGLSDFLSRKKAFSTTFHKTFIEKLTVMPGGTLPHNPSELLSSGLMRRLIDEVRQRYTDRYIIIDTPPPYITSEVNALARQVDGVIIVIKNGVAKKKDVKALINIYGRKKILGVVSNFSDAPRRYKYAGYYRYKS